MQLTKVAETSSTITLGWDAVPDAIGYRFTAERLAKPSHTWNPEVDTVKFSKGSSWYKVEALSAQETGEYPPPLPPTFFPSTTLYPEV